MDGSRTRKKKVDSNMKGVPFHNIGLLYVVKGKAVP
jgi:hypothetical protein